MNSTIRSLLDEPKVENPPPVGWLDRVFLGLVLCGLTIEAFVRTDLVWKPVALSVSAVLAFGLLIRRRHPLLALTAVIGSFFIFDVSATLVGRGPVEVYSNVYVLLLIYAVFRWGSGLDAARGLGVLAVMAVTIQLTNYTGVGDLIGGTFVLLFGAALATVIRYQDSIRQFRDERQQQELERIKLAEREQLARDLHDTVAHHVSAIAIQAQAGQVLAATSPHAAIDALAVIENEASRTLAEMRAIVRALRDDEEDAEHAPQQGIADIPALATTVGSQGLHIDVAIEGPTDGLAPSIDAAVYRLAQESITNARRHAKGASHVNVAVNIGPDTIVLAVTDDGASPTMPTESEGWGLVGMTERAELLGGTLSAGPVAAGGWRVHAELPRDRSRVAGRS